MRGAAAFALGALLGACITPQFARPYYGPRLVALGCPGAAGPIYADKRTDFPRCAQIVAFGSISE